MMDVFKKIFHKKDQKSGFSDFFRDASNDDKKRLLEKVVREANQDQKDLVEKYNKLHSKTAY
jgi:predicted CopG family antitoxin